MEPTIGLEPMTCRLRMRGAGFPPVPFQALSRPFMTARSPASLTLTDTINDTFHRHHRQHGFFMVQAKLMQPFRHANHDGSAQCLCSREAGKTQRIVQRLLIQNGMSSRAALPEIR